MIEKIAYLFTQGIRNIKWRMSFCAISVSVITAVLLILGIFVAAGLNVNSLTEKLGDSCEINVYVRDGADGIEQELIKIHGVKKVRFCSKDERLAKVTEEVYGTEESLFAEGINPLRDSYIVTVSELSQINQIYGDIEAVDGVEDVIKNSDIISDVSALIKVVRNVGIIIAIILILIAILIISGTIRLSVASGEEEIRIMKIVGATNSFITLPYIIQGVILGVVGALIALMLTAFGYETVSQRIAYIISTDIVTLVGNGKVILVSLPLFVVSGAAVGAFGSFFAVRKYLK